MLLLAQTRQQRQVVAAVCAGGAAQGIVAGMAVSDARAVLRGSVVVAEHDGVRDAKSLLAMAMWAHRFSPVVAVDPPDGLLLDITGCAHLFGGEEAMLRRVAAEFGALGMRAVVCVAPTFGAARAVARFGAGGSVVEPAGLHDAIDRLALASIGIDGRVIAGMAEVGIKTVGELLALPRGSVAARFGDGVLRRIDEVMGRQAEVIEPIRPVDPPRAERLFAGPCCCVETIGLACRGVLEEVCGELSRRGRGLTHARVTLMRSDLDPLVLTLRLSAASREPAHLWSLLRPRLERAQLGFGVEGVEITALRLGVLREEQQRWWGEGGGDGGDVPGAGVDQLLDTLVNRLGKDSVVRPVRVESHVPERSFRLVSVLEEGVRVMGRAVEADRPSVLYERAIGVDVIALTPDGPVSRFVWDERVHEIRACLGPERIAPEWWRRERSARDYYKVQDESGQWFWLYCEVESRAWFLQGVWA